MNTKKFVLATKRHCRPNSTQRSPMSRDNRTKTASPYDLMATQSLLRYECKGNNCKLNQKEQIQERRERNTGWRVGSGRVFGSRKEQANFLLSKRLRLALRAARTRSMRTGTNSSAVKAVGT